MSATLRWTWPILTAASIGCGVRDCSRGRSAANWSDMSTSFVIGGAVGDLYEEHQGEVPSPGSAWTTSAKSRADLCPVRPQQQGRTLIDPERLSIDHHAIKDGRLVHRDVALLDVVADVLYR